jgi:ParB family chromosome partitioning protein
MGSTEKGNTKKTKRARLGRGLSALVDAAPIKVDPSLDVDPARGETASTPGRPNILQTDSRPDEKDRVIEVALDRVAVNPNQPRRVFDTEALESLAASIRAHGLMQPIVVRVGEGAGAYELIAGERRWRAAKLAGMTTIRAIVDDADDERSAELALIENMQREDLNPIERALGLRQLMDRFGSTQQELSDRIGMSRPGLANLLRLLDLGDDLQALVATGVLSVGHAKVLLSCHDETQRSKLAHDAIEQGWTVRALEQAIASAGSVVPASPETAGAGEQGAHAVLHPDRVGSVLRDLERSLSEHLGTRVTLKTNKQGTKGRVQIEFFDLDQFDGLLAKLGVHGERV